MLLLIPAFLSACAAQKPYVYTDYRFHQRGTVIACYNEDTATLEQATALVEEICQNYDRTAKLQLVQRYQCSWAAPTQAQYSCVPRPGESPAPIIPHKAPMRHDPPLRPW